MTKYVRTGAARVNKAYVRQDMNARADEGEFMAGVYTVHETDEPDALLPFKVLHFSQYA